MNLGDFNYFVLGKKNQKITIGLHEKICFCVVGAGRRVLKDFLGNVRKLSN